MSHIQKTTTNPHRIRRPAAAGLCLVGLALSSSPASAAHSSHGGTNAAGNRELQVDKTVLGVGPVTFFEQPSSSSLNPTAGTGGGSSSLFNPDGDIDDGSSSSESGTAVTPGQIEQIQQIMESFALGGERGHLKDPDLLDGDNPGWTNPPTKQPTARPTLRPTSSPTASPTLSPTLSPTASPTASPTSSPTSGPTSSPTIDPCQISAATYAYFHPDATSSLAATPMAVEVPFVYEVGTTVEYGEGEMNGEVLPRVERALGDGLLPLVFAECAVGGGGGGGASGSGSGSGSGGGGSTTEMGGRGASAGSDGDGASGTDGGRSTPLTDGSVVGITTSPPDLAVTDVDATCTATLTRPGNSCTVVEGILTIYVPAESTLAPFGDDGRERQERIDALVRATQDAIQEAMDSGMLNDGAVDESIETVTYGRDGPYQEPIVALGTGGGENGTRNAGGGFPVYIAIAGGAVAVGAALLIVGAKMRSRQNEDKEDCDSDDDDDDEDFDGGDDENDVSGFHDNPTEVAERGGKSTYDMDPVAADIPSTDADLNGQIEGGDWAAVGTTAAVLASAPDAPEAASDDGRV